MSGGPLYTSKLVSPQNFFFRAPDAGSFDCVAWRPSKPEGAPCLATAGDDGCVINAVSAQQRSLEREIKLALDPPPVEPAPPAAPPSII